MTDESMTEVTSQRAAASPREVVQQMHRLAQENISAQADLYAPDGVLEWPFAPPGVPRRVEGREEIRRVLQAIARGLGQDGGSRITGLADFHLHETSDPEVVVVEFEVEAELPSGETARLPYVQVFRIRNGEIRSFRDYFGPATAQAVTLAIGAPATQN